MRADLHELIIEYHGNVNLENIQDATIDECSLTFLQLHDRLCLLGQILFEDEEKEVCVAYIRSGLGNLSGATVAMKLQNGKLYLAGYAREGLIKQSICESAIQKLSSVASGGEVLVSTKFPRRIAILLAIITMVVIVLVRNSVVNRVDPDTADDKLPFSSEVVVSEDTATKESAEELAFKQSVYEAMEATTAYNSAIGQFNTAVNEYNAAVAITSIENISGLPTELEMLATVDESYDKVATSIKNGNSAAKIKTDSVTIMEMEQQVKEMTKIVQQITVPSCEWIKARLIEVDSVTEVQAVTTENDPDGLFGKTGGYVNCVYFTVKEIDSSFVPGETIIEKGTDAGGSVEVYATVEEAKARCGYLSEFDGTILYSGSYAIVGTMVIRTSYKLTNQQQIDLTTDITETMITLK